MPSLRRMSGKMFNGYREVLSESGKLALVRQKCSPAVAAFLDGPPTPPKMQDDEILDDLIGTYHQLFGDSATQQFSQAAARKIFGSKILPLMSAVGRLFGATPAQLFARLDSFKFAEGLILSGYQFSFTPRDANNGTVRLTVTEPLRSTSFIAWQGVLALVYDLGSRAGTVSMPTIAADRLSATYEATWV